MKSKKENLKGAKKEDLEKKLLELEEKIRVLKFKAEGAKSKNVKEGMSYRRQIARILTELTSQAKQK